MKTGNIGIRNIVGVGTSDIDIYGIDKTKYEGYQRKEKVKLRIGVFFDGTGNNKYNSDKVYYNKNVCKHPIDEAAVPKVNLKSFEIQSGSSYWNAYSNIALLHDLYEEKRDWKDSKNVKTQDLQLKFYIEGIGTLRDTEDDKLGSGMGEGDRGVIARVEQACQMIAASINTLFSERKKVSKKSQEIISIQFDVFGFSRGAAAARHFCNEVLKTGVEKMSDKIPLSDIKRPTTKKNEEVKEHLPNIKLSEVDVYKVEKDNTKVGQRLNAPFRDVFVGGKLGDFLREKKIHFPKYNVSIEFLGLYDTVISQMLERKGSINVARNPINKIIATILSPLWTKPIVGAGIEKLGLIKKINPDLSNPNIKKILHLKAQTEWRENFPITPIGKISSTSYAKELTVLGAHSDVGGAYWNTTEELSILHFSDLGVYASDAEKQKMEEQKEYLRDWYISQKLCQDDQAKLYWETKHHIKVSHKGSFLAENILKDENFMGNQTVKYIDDKMYTLEGYHYKLIAKRPLNNKLSLVYMNIMKYIALNYAAVPFLIPVDKTQHPEEYIYPEGNEHEKDLKKYYEILEKVAESGWVNKEGKVVNYPNLIDQNGLYNLSPEMYNYIMGNFVHLSANFNAPLAEELDHYNIAYANVPHFTDEKEFKNPPYKRESYTPVLGTYDKS